MLKILQVSLDTGQIGFIRKENNDDYLRWLGVSRMQS